MSERGYVRIEMTVREVKRNDGQETFVKVSTRVLEEKCEGERKRDFFLPFLLVKVVN